jgi:hypothetical protein
MTPPEDPLSRLAAPLAAVLLAVALSVFIAALIGGALPFDYTGRALAFMGLVLYVIVGAVLVFRAAAAGESGPFSAQRVGKWLVSLWLWPLLLLARRRV